MEMYVGLTDYEWYLKQKGKGYDEVNFWKPGTTSFKALKPNDLFLFKLKKPYYSIVGGAFFVGYSQLPIDIAWETFAEKNGTESKDVFYRWILDYKRKNNMDMNNPHIGCIVLTEPFFFEPDQWIKPMEDWSSSIVQGKKYDTAFGEGKRVYDEVMQRIKNHNSIEIENETTSNAEKRLNAYYESLTKHRLGQGAFRVMVTDAYHRECAITGEKVLPVLEAAHIKAFAEEGPNEVNNGILLRSDIHTLFDRGYLTIDTSYCVDVSSLLKDDYGDCEQYYQYHGKKIGHLPDNEDEKPLKEYLLWHNENVFKG